MHAPDPTPTDHPVNAEPPPPRRSVSVGGARRYMATAAGLMGIACMLAPPGVEITALPHLQGDTFVPAEASPRPYDQPRDILLPQRRRRERPEKTAARRKRKAAAKARARNR